MSTISDLTCSKAITLIESIKQANLSGSADAEARRAPITATIERKTAQKYSIKSPARLVSDYPNTYTLVDGITGDVRANALRNYCANYSGNGVSQGNWEWDGVQIKDDAGRIWNVCGVEGPSSGSCQTRGYCRVKQSYIDGLVAEYNNQIRLLDDEIAQLNKDRNSIVWNNITVPNIGCCQTIMYNNISGDTINFDKNTQTCTVINNNPPPVTPSNPSPTAPTPTPSVPSSTSSTSTTTNDSIIGAEQPADTSSNKMIFFFVIIIALMFVAVIGLVVVMNDDSESFIGKLLY